jgi:hypothetical protein
VDRKGIFSNQKVGRSGAQLPLYVYKKSTQDGKSPFKNHTNMSGIQMSGFEMVTVVGSFEIFYSQVLNGLIS